MLEYIVRPFQAPANTGQIIIPSTPSTTTDQAVLTWGAKATMPGIVPTGINVVCCKEQNDELSRQTEKVNVTSSQDPSNFITVERSKQLSLDKKEDNKCGDDWDSFSGVGAAISSAFSTLDAAIGPSLDVPQKCSVVFNLNNGKTGGNTASSQGLSSQAPAS